MNQKGQVMTSVLMWGAGVIIAGVVGLSSYFVKSETRLEDRIYKQEGVTAEQKSDIASIKTDLTNIKGDTAELKAMMNELLKKQGVYYVAPVTKK